MQRLLDLVKSIVHGPGNQRLQDQLGARHGEWGVVRHRRSERRVRAALGCLDRVARQQPRREAARLRPQEDPLIDASADDSRTERDRARLEALDVDAFGNIRNWPQGFFGDEMEDLVARTKAQSKRTAGAAETRR